MCMYICKMYVHILYNANYYAFISTICGNNIGAPKIQNKVCLLYIEKLYYFPYSLTIITLRWQYFLLLISLLHFCVSFVHCFLHQERQRKISNREKFNTAITKNMEGFIARILFRMLGAQILFSPPMSSQYYF